jgi:hypothetical protein
MDAELVQVAARSRKLATQVDNLVIEMRQRGARQPGPEDAAAALTSVAPLLQALIRYQLAMLEALLTERQPPG